MENEETRKLLFPSVEHAFQAITCLHPKDMALFAAGSDFADPEMFCAWCYNLKVQLPHIASWKMGKNAVGWIAKFVTSSPKIMEKFGLRTRSSLASSSSKMQDYIRNENGKAISQKDALLSALIAIKFSNITERNNDLKKKLKKTRNSFLLEMHGNRGKLNRWNGKIIYADEKRKAVKGIEGANMCGKLIMKTRVRILEKKQK